MVSGVIKVDALLEKMTLELQNYLKARNNRQSDDYWHSHRRCLDRRSPADKAWN